MFKGCNVKLEREWYEIRDLLLGYNTRHQNVDEALVKASQSKHYKAIWLCNIFKTHVIGVANALASSRKCLLEYASQNNDCEARVFAGIITFPIIVSEIMQAASDGSLFAMVFLFRYNGFYSLDMLENAMSKSTNVEREIFHDIGLFADKSIECRMKYYKAAAQLGCFNSMNNYALYLSLYSVERWKWRCKAATVFCLASFMDEVVQMLERNHVYDPKIVFYIGRFFKYYSKQSQRKSIQKAIDFFSIQCIAAKTAVDAFSLCCLRLGLYKDLRVMIGKLVWKGKKETNYKV
jgi:hypothetical protein